MTAALLRRRALTVGLPLLALFAIGAVFAPRAALRGWLAAAVFWTGVSLGALILLLTHDLTGGRWGHYVRPTLRAAAASLPVALLAFLPLLLTLDLIFPWTAETLPEVVQRKSAYLNAPFFIARALAYFAAWLLIAHLAGVWRAGRPRPLASALGLVAYGLTVTFFGVDWLLSLTPEFYSTTIGYMVGTGQAVAGLSFAILVAAVLPPAASADEAPPLADLGNLLLAAVMLWAYIAYTKFLIVWSADLPNEIVWYLDRTGRWRWLTLLVIAIHFVVPFVVLLSRRVKRCAAWLGGVGGLLLLAHVADVFWWVLPSFSSAPGWSGVLAAAAPLALGGPWLAVFAWRLREQAHG